MTTKPATSLPYPKIKKHSFETEIQVTGAACGKLFSTGTSALLPLLATGALFPGSFSSPSQRALYNYCDRPMIDSTEQAGLSTRWALVVRELTAARQAGNSLAQ